MAGQGGRRHQRTAQRLKALRERVSRSTSRASGQRRFAINGEEATPPIAAPPAVAAPAQGTKPAPAAKQTEGRTSTHAA